jgi:phospholipase C
MPIEHVFVLMLENRSFDHMFALSGIPGINVATAADTNSFDGQTYAFQGGAPDHLPSDPLHDFGSVLQQLSGKTDCTNATPYPTRNNSGFVANFSTTTVPHGLFGKRPLPPADYGMIMQGIDTARQAPALYALACNYALCDNWYSSLPGPTWPNRFFVHGASSDGMDNAPSGSDIVKWETFKGFVYPHGSIYDRLGQGNYRLYQDKTGPLSGRIPQVASLRGINYFDVASMADFERDLASGYTAKYTFIEPAYGDMVFDTYRGGTSQHPMDGLAGGDGLIARVYNAIRQSPLWDSSLLIITYDEHGGFYDSAAPTGAPPHPAPPPNDGTGAHQNGHNFDFSEFGVRVPAVIVSPWIAANSVDHTLYDHASVLATVEQLFDLDPLTDRDKHANALLSLIGTKLRPDHDCLPPLPVGPVSPAAMAMTAADSHVDPDEPIENSSDLAAFLFVVRKADRERLGDLAAMTRFQPVASRADAQRYIDETVPKLEALRGTAAGTA